MYSTDARHTDPRLAQKLAQLYSLHGSGAAIDLTIRQPYFELLERLGNPHRHVPPTIHVAGTNGKGSTIAFMRAMLEAAGKRVHVYTSPHLVRFNERIVLAGNAITDDWLESLLDECVDLNRRQSLTFFEITTALAFAAFARQPADFLLLETGLGGRLDCTNVIGNPAATVITAIGYDHMEFLGDSIGQIAGEKAGILKPGAPCVLASQTHATASDAIAVIANSVGAPVLRAGHGWVMTHTADGYVYRSGNRDLVLGDLSLKGRHQYDNAATAIAALDAIGLDLSDDTVRAGLSTAHWLARLQRLDARAFGLPDHIELWLDGGHNEAAAHIMASQAEAWQRQDDRPLDLVIGMLQTKDATAFLTPMAGHIARLYAVGIENEPKARSPSQLRDEALSLGIADCHEAPTFHPALKMIAQHDEARRVLICGSLYLAGQVLAHVRRDN